METKMITEAQTGCYLDNHRGHYITRDAIQLAEGFGFIIGPFEEFALGMYEEHSHEDEYPNEALIELCEDAVNWLNSGQDVCPNCDGSGTNPYDGQYWTHKDDPEQIKRCKTCTGTGQGPRIEHQNFPPKLPEGYMWGFNDGDFGLYKDEEEE
jgi:hypothetical protein